MPSWVLEDELPASQILGKECKQVDAIIISMKVKLKNIFTTDHF